MADLAALAGVSKMTVSRALRDSPLVTPETRALVQDLAQRHGYKVNVTARNLRLQRSQTIEVVIEMRPAPDRPMSGSYPLELLGGICQELTSADYNVILTTQPARKQAVLGMADGIILLGQGPHGDAVKEWREAGLPLVVWGAATADPSTVVVGSDNRQGGASAAERFTQLGRSRLVFLGDVDHAEIAERHDGFVEALPTRARKVTLIRPAAFTFGAGFDAVTKHLAKGGKPIDGLFAANDLLAMGAIRALTDAGLHVPDAVSVIGYDDTPMAASFVPPLTSIHQDWGRGGALLAKKVLQLLDGEPVRSETLPTALVVRGS